MTDQATPRSAPDQLTDEQVRFFEIFGFLHLPGFFRDEIGAITDAFEEVFAAAEAPIETHEAVHFGERRLIVMHIVDQHPVLAALRTDPRVLGVVERLMGPAFEWRGSDGNLLDCDTTWHCDIYDSPLEIFHLKLFFYLDPLRADTGAVRVIPGTHHWESDFAVRLREVFTSVHGAEERLGVAATDVPAHVIETDPGDLVLGSFRTIHATFGGPPRRRLFTMNYRQLGAADGPTGTQ